MMGKIAEDVSVYSRVVGIFSKNIEKLSEERDIEYDEALLVEVRDDLVELNIAVYACWQKMNAAKIEYLRSKENDTK